MEEILLLANGAMNTVMDSLNLYLKKATKAEINIILPLLNQAAALKGKIFESAMRDGGGE